MSAFEASEIIEQILRWCDKSSINKCARVSKQWSEIALDLLWHEITDLKALLSPLGVFGYKKTAVSGGGITLLEKPASIRTYELVSQPTNKGWMRLEIHYAPRVRVLRLGPIPEALSRPLDVLCRIRRSSKPLLPNLKTIYYSGLSGKGLMEPLFLFVHEDILEFTLDAREKEPYVDATQIVLEGIHLRMPQLKKLDITVGSDSRYFSSINEVMRNLPSLESVTTSASTDLVALFSFFVTLKNLKTLHITPRYQSNGLVISGMTIFPILGPMKCFRALETLTLFSDYSTASSMLCCMTFPRLESLKILTEREEYPLGLQILLSNIQKSCPNLVRLSLDIESLARSRISQGASRLCVQTTPDLYCVTITNLRPILSISTTFMSFEILYPFRMNLGLNDVEEIASAWPRLKSLNLNAAPLNASLFPTMQRLDLHALLPFARHCPDIEELGIFLNAEYRTLPSESDVDALPSHWPPELAFEAV
ncbi:hypothetical protein K435DRAFT_875301 [Dendrothele bispora CBS 962.96]|uniref:F-box domain-containing protein n=1 Tax=Dendrothele bispora (strain CBS 962.96) TaxID=1314807 RepID=A0A4S8KV14_DENBC|nr:hypothetical protein K435DRAFT_875301 [Dendrothele bispora CBS 962.96]